MWQVLWSKAQLATDLSPTTIGNVRESFVREFLALHLPGDLIVGTGHLLVDFEGGASPQIDLFVSHKSGLALPMGNVSLVLPEGVVACIEVKSTLTREHFLGQIAKIFRSLPAPEPDKPKPLKAVVAVQLEGGSQHRHILKKWASDGLREGILTENELPDMVIILDNAAVIKGGALKCLEDTTHWENKPGELYKFGDYETQKWAGLMLLVFELAQRVGRVDWTPYIKPVLEGTKDTEGIKIKELPDN